MALLLRRPAATCQCHRAFSTSVPRAISLQWDKNDPEALAAAIPPYPYGPTLLYKQSRTGPYGGQRIRYGNNIGTKIEVKTRRSWKPNILTRRLFSKALNRHVQVRVSARVLRTIDKLGGVDRYLLGETAARIKALGESGWWLRWAIMQTPAVKRQFAERRAQLGLLAPAGSMTAEEAHEAGQDLAWIEETAIADAKEDEVGAANLEALSLEDSEPVATDDAFVVDSSPTLPRLVFRVGYRQHVILTPQGWRRTRPDPQRFIDQTKAKIAASHYPNFVEERVGEFTRRLTELNEAETRPDSERLTPEEKDKQIKMARRAFRRQLEERVEKRLEQRRKTQKTGKLARRTEQNIAAAQDESAEKGSEREVAPVVVV